MVLASYYDLLLCVFLHIRIRCCIAYYQKKGILIGNVNFYSNCYCLWMVSIFTARNMTRPIAVQNCV